LEVDVWDWRPDSSVAAISSDFMTVLGGVARKDLSQVPRSGIAVTSTPLEGNLGSTKSSRPRADRDSPAATREAGGRGERGKRRERRTKGRNMAPFGLKGLEFSERAAFLR
jgi:hypothetical protein